MKSNLKYSLQALFVFALLFGSCTEQDFTLGELTAPSNIVIDTEIMGQDANNPDGDGSGDVKITVSSDNAIAYKIDFGTGETLSLETFSGTATKKYTKTGVFTYRITIVAFGAGGTSSVATKDITVRSDFNVDPVIVTNLTGDSSKTWIVDKSVAGHMGVGPWTGEFSPIWWQAGVNEKVNCCNCFYTTQFTFTKNSASNTFSLQVTSPDGAFTKTGSLASIPGIPSSGAEGCYAYGGGTESFSFVPSATGNPNSLTQTAILLSGSTVYIGYGSLQKEYEIVEITPTVMKLRIQGTETGNAWYLTLIPAVL
ncbi:MAG: hypothetical protein CVT96_06790 [Bacteroidetes bacterium HGW-Bacteroidetes-13]|nr:MAG: hypothetical protein CVT96_06790 [Bacteroidetes bacterium HGW-Bacteroidetes-13]